MTQVAYMTLAPTRLATVEEGTPDTEVQLKLTTFMRGQPGQGHDGAVRVTYANPCVVDVSVSESVFDIELAGNGEIQLTGGSEELDGKRIILRLEQDGVGNRVPTWGAMVRFGVDIPSLTLSTTPGKTDYVGLLYRHSEAKYDLIAFARSY